LEEELTLRTVEPYSLKGFSSRCYVLANDRGAKLIKTFALDCVSNLEITKRSFNYLKSFDSEDHFKNCYGIISSADETPKEIVLFYDAFQGKYIKSLPLDET
jgi:predicted DNA-binding transcriptional regulator YafY